MSDSTQVLDTVSQSTSQPAAQVNALVDAGSPSLMFGRRASQCAALVFGYYGGRFNGTSVANGTVTATASTVCYVVAHRTTLVVSISTATTNWNDTATYGRMYKLTPGGSTIPTWEDHRNGTGGILTPDLTSFGGGDMVLATVQTVTGKKTFGAAGAVGKFALAGTTSGSTILDASATASGTLTLPAATDTLVGKATSDVLTNKTYDTAGTGNSFSINGVAATANTGTGAVARAAGPTFTTPTLGVAVATSINGNILTTGTWTLTGSASKTLTFSNTLTLAGTDSTTMTFPGTSATIARTDAANTFTGTQTFGTVVGTTWNGNTWATGTGTLSIAASKTLTASNSITLAGTDSTTMTFPPASASIGYLNVPQNSQSTAYTTVLADAGKHILHPAADTTARTFTIDSNANVAYPIGTAITFVNEHSGGVVTIAITSDTMRLAGAGTTGSRTLAADGIATALKITSTSWIISGTGLT